MIDSRWGSPRTQVLYDESRGDLRTAGRPRPVRVYEWEPLQPAADPAPVVLVSHGTGGSGSGMAWLAGPLAAAGFRVLAVDHHGNNVVDGYEPEGFLCPWERPRDLLLALDVLGAPAGGPELGPVGAAGFSAGGYTAAALAGARIDEAVAGALLSGAVPLPDIPEFPGVLEAFRAKVPAERLEAAMAGAGADLADPRVRAVFQVAPGLGAMVTAESLAAVQVPVEVHWGGADTVNPYEVDVRPYLEGIPAAIGRSVGPDVTHGDFIGADPVPRAARARAAVAADAVAFFRRHLV
ncbi:alpha/beta hydrolase family protein [Kitasatospora sp. NPDC059571]|uniref:alpha/beta hydrolase family protein n=1 Tax=Kitasatospora sp. NPDC059571 TaxID=3346871 RepID=UPI00369FA0DF